jgi:hypothetical protein
VPCLEVADSAQGGPELDCEIAEGKEIHKVEDIVRIDQLDSFCLHDGQDIYSLTRRELDVMPSLAWLV